MTTPVERTHQAEKHPDHYGRGAAVGYTGAYSEPSTAELQDVVALQNARGPE